MPARDQQPPHQKRNTQLLDMILSSPLALFALGALYFLIRNIVSDPSLSQLSNFPKHLRECQKLFQKRRDKQGVLSALMAASYRLVSPFFGLLKVTLMALPLLLLASLALPTALVLAVYADATIQIMQLLFNRKIVKPYFMGLCYQGAQMALRSFLKRFNKPASTAASADHSTAKKPLDVFGASTFIIKSLSFSELKSFLQAYQQRLKEQGSNIDALLDVKDRKKALFILGTLIAEEEQARPGSSVARVIPKALDLLLQTRGTPDSVEHPLHELLAYYYQAASLFPLAPLAPSPENPTVLPVAAPVVPEPNQKPAAPEVFQPTESQQSPVFIGLKTQEVLDAAPASAVDILREKPLLVHEIVGQLNTLFRKDNRSASIKKLCQDFCDHLAKLLDEPSLVDEAMLEKFICDTEAYLQTAAPSEPQQEKIFELFAKHTGLADFSLLDKKKKKSWAQLKFDFKKELFFQFKSQTGLLEQGGYEIIRDLLLAPGKLSARSLSASTAEKAYQSTFIFTALQRVSQFSQEQKDFLFDLVIAELFPSFDVRRPEMPELASNPLQHSAASFNQQRESDKEIIKELLNLVLEHPRDPADLLKQVRPEMIDVVRRPEHRESFRALIGFALYKLFKYNSDDLKNDKIRNINAGLLQQPLPFSGPKWLEHIQAIRQAPEEQRSAVAAVALASLFPHLGHAQDPAGEPPEVLASLSNHVLSLCASELSDHDILPQLYQHPIYDGQRLPHDWSQHGDIGQHFIDDLAHYILTAEHISSAYLLELIRTIVVFDEKGKMEPDIPSVILKALSGKKQGQRYDHQAIREFMSQNPAGLSRFAIKIVLGMIKPQKDADVRRLEELLTEKLWALLNNPPQEREQKIISLCEGAVDIASGIQLSQQHDLQLGLLKVGPAFSQILSQLTQADSAADRQLLMGYYEQIDKKINKKSINSLIPSIGTLSYLNQYAQSRGMGLETAIPHAIAAWQSYDQAQQYSSSLLSNAALGIDMLGSTAESTINHLIGAVVDDDGLIAEIATSSYAYCCSWLDSLGITLSTPAATQEQQPQEEHEEIMLPQPVAITFQKAARQHSSAPKPIL